MVYAIRHGRNDPVVAHAILRGTLAGAAKKGTPVEPTIWCEIQGMRYARKMEKTKLVSLP